MFPAVIATAAFVIAFVALGVTVVLAAMRSGRRAPAKAGPATSRDGRGGATTALTLFAVLIGLGVPLAVMITNSDRKAKDAIGGVDLTANQAEGRQLFARNCSTCHTLRAANSVGKVGPNLDVLRPPASLTLNAIKMGRARGRGQMPAELLDGQDAKNVASFLAAVAGR